MIYNLDGELEVTEYEKDSGLYLIPNINGYLIDKNGTIYNSSNLRKVSQQTNKKGYLISSLCTKRAFSTNVSKRFSIAIHRLLAITFIKKPVELLNIKNSKLTVNHKDGNKLNNCLYNLEWCTNKQNIDHALHFNLIKSNYILVKNIKDNSIKEIKGEGECSKKYNINRALLHKHLNSIRAGTLTRNWNLFKYNDNKPWPLINTQLVSENSLVEILYWKAYNYKTKERFEFKSLEEVASFLNTTRGNLNIFRIRHGENTPFKDWYISLEKIYDEFKFPVKSKEKWNIKVTNLSNNTFQFFNSIRSCSKYLDIKRQSLSSRLNKEKLFTTNNFKVEKL